MEISRLEFLVFNEVSSEVGLRERLTWIPYSKRSSGRIPKNSPRLMPVSKARSTRMLNSFSR